MSSPIMPIRDLRAPSQSKPPAAEEASNLTAFVAELAASERSLTIQDTRSAPPQEVLEQMAHAGAIGEQMRERGQEVRFSLSEAGRVTAELEDGEGSAPRTLSMTEVFDIAAGKSLE